jgi:RNase P protein component
MLFHMLPGGEIQPTHLGSSPGAHLTPDSVGKMFECFEALTLTKNPVAVTQQALADALLHLLVTHPDYKDGRQQLLEEVQKAESALANLQKRDAESKSVRAEIKRLEGDVIKVCRHKIKRISKELLTANPESVEQLEHEIVEQEAIVDETKKEVARLHTHIVTSLDFKLARKALRRAKEAVTLEEERRAKLTETLADCWCSYDLDDAQPQGLPKYTTTAILQAYLWRKYDSIKALKGYFESMSRLGALNRPIASIFAILDRSDGFAVDRNDGYLVPRHNESWSAHDIESAAVIITGKPGVVNRPSVIPFSYITWADYTEFPDCGETALRNLVNQILYNPITGTFDHNLLSELQVKHYPGMNPKLIEFYKQHAYPQDAANHDAARDWIKVVSGLNEGRERNALRIRYRREKQEQNIASPLSNVLRVFNALFGIEPLDHVSLPEVVHHISEIQSIKLHVDMSGLKESGFGIVSLNDGMVRYEMQSYKPVHFGFIQAETLQSETAGRDDYHAFCQLMRHSCADPVAAPKDPAYFEQLSVASMFVPYQLQRNKIKRFFRESPLHYLLLFADLNGQLQRDAALRWACQQPTDRRLSFMMDHIRSYEVPSFLPPSASTSNH